MTDAAGATAPVHAVQPITARSRVFALLGDPVRHSLSPSIHNAGFRAAGLDAVYVSLACGEASVRPLLRSIAVAGGGGNITVPHKRSAAEALDRATAAVERTGACNTFWVDDGEVHGDNTDVEGFIHAAHRLVPDLAGIRTLVLGAGGAAAAVLVALLDHGASHIAVLNRTPGRARGLAGRLDPEGRRITVLAEDHDFADLHIDLAVNATSVGLRPDDPLPFDLSRLGSVSAALDLVYSPAGTAWTAHARSGGVPAEDGTEMLLAQACASFERWWSLPAPLDAMRAALL